MIRDIYWTNSSFYDTLPHMNWKIGKLTRTNDELHELIATIAKKKTACRQAASLTHCEAAMRRFRSKLI